MNTQIKNKLEELNSKEFTKKKGSKRSAFLEEEKPFLMPLPTTPYEPVTWSKVTVPLDYLITVENVKYSVPYTLIGKKVEICVSNRSIEVYYGGDRVAYHIRKNQSPDPIYLVEHMPERHKLYQNYNADAFLEWGAEVGKATHMIVQSFLMEHKEKEQGYKDCVSLRKYAQRYTPQRLEIACSRCLKYSKKPTIRNISTILKNGQDKVSKGQSIVKPRKNVAELYGFERSELHTKKNIKKGNSNE